MSISTLYAIVTCALIVFLLCPTKRLPPAGRLVVLLAAPLLILLPIGDISILIALRGTFGDLSVFTVCWLLCSALERIWPGSTPLSMPQQRVFAAGVIVVSATLLYPFAMGLTQWDSYRLGYGLPLVGATLAMAIVAYYLRQLFTLMALTACLAAYALLILESRNFWDYLIDPALSVYAIGVLVSAAISYKRSANPT